MCRSKKTTNSPTIVRAWETGGTLRLLSRLEKAQRYKTADAGGADAALDDVDVGGSGDSSPGPSPSPSPSPPLTGPLVGRRSSEEQEREDKGGWAKKKWRAVSYLGRGAWREVKN